MLHRIIEIEQIPRRGIFPRQRRADFLRVGLGQGQTLRADRQHRLFIEERIPQQRGQRNRGNLFHGFFALSDLQFDRSFAAEDRGIP